MKRGIVFTALFFFVFSICIASETPEQIVKKVEENFQNSGAMRISFKEMYQWKLTNEEHKTAGTLIIKGQDKFRITTDDQVIVSDGKTLWTFSKQSNRVVVDKLKENDNTLLPRKIFLEYTEDYRSFLKGEEIVSGSKCYVLDFTDEKGDKLFPKVRVWVDKESFMPRKIRQTDLSGNVTIFMLVDIVTKIKTSISDFIFTVPAGVEIIDLRTL